VIWKVGYSTNLDKSDRMACPILGSHLLFSGVVGKVRYIDRIISKKQRSTAIADVNILLLPRLVSKVMDSAMLLIYST
jgi:hypothetical protein